MPGTWSRLHAVVTAHRRGNWKIAMVITTAPLLMAGGCWDPACSPNCGCQHYGFPASGSVAFSQDSIRVPVARNVAFSLSVPPVEVAGENDEGRLAWYDTVVVIPSVESVAVRIASGSWRVTIGTGGGSAFELPFSTPEGWLAMTTAWIRVPSQVCPMYSNDIVGPLSVSSDSLRVVASAIGFAVFTDSAQFFSAAAGATLTVRFPDRRDPTPAPYTENGVTLAPYDTATNEVGELTPLLTGNEFTVSYRAQNVDITFATPATAFGMWMVDQGNGVSGSTADSKFSFTFLDEAGARLGPLEIDPPTDKAFFVGFTFPFAVARLAMWELGSTGRQDDPRKENDYLGRIYTK